MPIIPVRVGDITALVDTGDKPKCCVPGCNGAHWISCDYPVKRNGRTATCDAKLCEAHTIIHRAPAGEVLGICPAHSRYAGAKR